MKWEVSVHQMVATLGGMLIARMTNAKLCLCRCELWRALLAPATFQFGKRLTLRQQFLSITSEMVLDLKFLTAGGGTIILLRTPALTGVELPNCFGPSARATAEVNSGSRMSYGRVRSASFVRVTSREGRYLRSLQ
jgi:hypothetical protein